MSYKEKILAWGKYESDSDFHCLEHHCADVATCFEVLIQDSVVRKRIECGAGISDLDETTASRLAVVAFFHDFAKLNSGFQFKVRNLKDSPPKAGHIREAYYCFEQPEILEALGFIEVFDRWGKGFEPLLLAALTHHGRPPLQSIGSGPDSLWQPFAGYSPLESAKRLYECSRNWFPKAFGSGPCLPDSPALAHLFAGFVSIADQVGSAKEDFPFNPNPDDYYVEIAREQSVFAMDRRGFRRDGRNIRARRISYSKVFEFDSLRPLQEFVAKASTDQRLLILESETGSGKTEASLIRFIDLWQKGLVDGLYFAVPTRSAAKQLHNRVNLALKRLFPPERWAETVLAIPGYIKSGENQGYPVEDFKVYWEDNPDEEQRAARWSAESARKFLSATTAVGTVDQALLGTLKVKWSHFRSAALSRSLLVIDEVHASDAYVTELLRQLLQDHLDLGGYAMLMSATLGTCAKSIFTSCKKRTEMPSAQQAISIPYPAITLTHPNTLEPQVHAITGPTNCKRINVRTKPWLNRPDQVATLALSEAKKGAKVLIIRNTVRTAQAQFEAVVELSGDEFLFEVNGIETLHHSRFAVEDRIELDEAIEQTLGKKRKGSGQIVIGTQTLEQSLDIDADYLISDICPIDVLLQRIGRLHRHKESLRPPHLHEPICVVLVPEEGFEPGLKGDLMKNGLGINDSGGGIYRNLLSVELTNKLIEDNTIWRIPDMNRLLVEAATHPENLAVRANELGGGWVSMEQKAYGIMAAEVQRAKLHLMDRSEPFHHHLKFTDNDDRIRTRLGEDGPRIRFEKPVLGPFGKDVAVFNLPFHLFSRSDLQQIGEEPIRSDNIEQIGQILSVRIGSSTYHYDRLGFRKASAK